jgi:hypothetical protein
LGAAVRALGAGSVPAVISLNCSVHRDVDVESYAREIGVLADWEEVR